MMTNTERSDGCRRNPARRGHLVLAFAAALVVVSCTEPMAMRADAGAAGAPDAADAAIDPTGNWDVELAYGPACDRPPLVEQSTFTVTRAATGYAIAADGATASGTLVCSMDDCKLSGMFLWSQATAQVQRSADLTLDANAAITGSGTERVVDGAGACSYAFTVGGRKT